MQNDKAQLIDTARRRKMVLEKRRLGYSYPEIAEAVADEFGADRLPNGWDERYAHKDLTRALRKVQDDLEDTAEEVRTLERLRLNAIYRGVATAAENGDTDAAREARKIIRRRCRMLGIDEPDEHDVNRVDYDLLGTILDALEGHVEARKAVGAAVAEQESDES